LTGYLAQLAASTFTQIGQYAGHRAYCYHENSLFSSLAVAVTIVSTLTGYPWTDDQAELDWEAYQDGISLNAYPSQY